MRLARTIVVAVVFGLMGDSASAAAARNACPTSGSITASSAKSSTGGFVTGEGKDIRLTGLLASDIGEEALAFLRAIGPLTLAEAGVPDRYNRNPAHVFSGAKWVQGELLRLGLARASFEPHDAPCVSALLAAEEEGRRSRAGHWGDGKFSVLSAEQLQRRGGTFQIVEAKVVSTALIKGRAFINFGPDYQTDFTVTVAPTDMREFRRAKFDIRALKDKRVRVRGWIDYYNGPEMDVALPTSIEVLD